MKASPIHSGFIHQETYISFTDYITLTDIISALTTLDVNGVDALLWLHASSAELYCTVLDRFH